jgi:hypothetical protein
LIAEQGRLTSDGRSPSAPVALPRAHIPELAKALEAAITSRFAVRDLLPAGEVPGVRPEHHRFGASGTERLSRRKRVSELLAVNRAAR